MTVPATIVTSHIESLVHRNLLQTFDAVVEETGEALPSDVNHPSDGNGKSLCHSSIGGCGNSNPKTSSPSIQRGGNVAAIEVSGSEGARPKHKTRTKEVEKLGVAPQKSPRNKTLEVEDFEETMAKGKNLEVRHDVTMLRILRMCVTPIMYKPLQFHIGIHVKYFLSMGFIHIVNLLPLCIISNSIVYSILKVHKGDNARRSKR